MTCNDEILAGIRQYQENRAREKTEAERLRDEHIVRESNKRLAFVKELIENNLLDAWQKSGIQLASVLPVENLGFPIP